MSGKIIIVNRVAKSVVGEKTIVCGKSARCNS